MTQFPPFSEHRLSFATDNLLLSFTLPVLPISSIGCSRVHFRATCGVADVSALTRLLESDWMSCADRFVAVRRPVCNMFDVHRLETKVSCQIAHLPSPAVDMMRHWNCFGVSLCILYWIWVGQFDSTVLLHLLSCLDMFWLQPYYLLPLCFRLETASGIFFACIV